MWQPVIVAYVPLMQVQTSVTAKEKKKGGGKKRKRAEGDICFYIKINKCSFWIYKHGFRPTLNYLQSTSSSFILHIVSSFSV